MGGVQLLEVLLSKPIIRKAYRAGKTVLTTDIPLSRAIKGEVSQAEMEKMILGGKKLGFALQSIERKKLLSLPAEGHVRTADYVASLEPGYYHDFWYQEIYNLKNHCKTVVNKDGSMSKILQNGKKVVIRKVGDKTVREVYEPMIIYNDKLEWNKIRTSEKTISTISDGTKTTRVKEVSDGYCRQHTGNGNFLKVSSKQERFYDNNEFTGRRIEAQDYCQPYHIAKGAPNSLKRVDNFDKNNKLTDVTLTDNRADKTLISYHIDKDGKAVSDYAEDIPLNRWLHGSSVWDSYRRPASYDGDGGAFGEWMFGANGC